MTDDLVKELRFWNGGYKSDEKMAKAADRIEELEAALRSVPKIVEFGFGNYKGCVDIKITREVKLFVQKALEGKDD